MTEGTAKRVLRVLNAEDGRPLVDVIAARWAIPEARVVALLSEGSLWVDGERCREGDRVLRRGQKIIAFVDGDRAEGVASVGQGGGGAFAAEGVEVAYVDADLAIVSKPAGLPSIPPRRGGVSLADAVAGRFGEAARLLHRLDRGASGLLVVSLRQESREALAAQVREHRLGRSYLAIVAGRLVEETLTLDTPLAVRRGRAVLDGHGAKEARTRVRALRRGAGRTLVAVDLETGRLHQIRAHLAGAGYPLLGDPVYGGPEAARLALHAHRLGLVHPISEASLEFHAPIPRALTAMWRGEG